MLIINADDYGWNRETTDRILTCFTRNRIHRASAMTFMADSERAADLAREAELPVGLHLNLDEELTGSHVPARLKEHHRATATYLNARKWNQIIYNPFLRNSFDSVFQAQWDEYARLYGEEPQRLDGHRHMHLCMNVLVTGKIPKGLQVRRNFTFYAGQKDIINRLYRRLVDLWLTRQFTCTSSFFSIHPIDPDALDKLVLLSRSSPVELMVHPGADRDYYFLLSPEWERILQA